MPIRIERLPVMLLAMLSLVVGLIAGLQRIGWSFHIAPAADHGGIMVGGFLGTLISLEKIIPLKKRLLFIVPILSGASVVIYFIGHPDTAMIILTLSSIGLSGVFVFYWIRQRSMLYAIMTLGAAAWLTGNLEFLHAGFYRVALPWWLAFTLLIISAERLELTQFLPVTPARKYFFTGLLALYLLSCFFTFHGTGGAIAATALVGIAVWLLRHDVIAINLKKNGLTKYTGIALLSGCFALILTGVFVLLFNGYPLGYDVIVHTYFIGFVFSMIFAHGPMILPGVLGIPGKPYHPAFYVWLLLLHGSWITRVVTDISLNLTIRTWSGMMTATAILGYFLTLAITTFRDHRAHAV